jgi:hypothetical protein
LNISGTVPKLQELNLAAGTLVVNPGADGYRLTDMLADVTNHTFGGHAKISPFITAN